MPSASPRRATARRRPRPTIPSVLPASCMPSSWSSPASPATPRRARAARPRRSGAPLGEHQRDREFGGRFGKDVRCVRDRDTGARGRGEIDVVDAHRAVRDQAQARRAREQRRIDAIEQQADERIGVGQVEIGGAPPAGCGDVDLQVAAGNRRAQSSCREISSASSRWRRRARDELHRFTRCSKAFGVRIYWLALIVLCTTAAGADPTATSPTTDAGAPPMAIATAAVNPNAGSGSAAASEIAPALDVKNIATLTADPILGKAHAISGERRLYRRRRVHVRRWPEPRRRRRRSSTALEKYSHPRDVLHRHPADHGQVRRDQPRRPRARLGEGFTVGSHSVSHPNLGKASGSELDKEIPRVDQDARD